MGEGTSVMPSLAEVYPDISLVCGWIVQIMLRKDCVPHRKNRNRAIGKVL